MSRLAIDLAERNSAGCQVVDDGSVERLWHTAQFGYSFRQFVDVIVETAGPFLPSPLRTVLIEDVPHGIPFHKATRGAIFKQGILASSLEEAGILAFLVQPRRWQTDVGLRKGRGESSAQYKNRIRDFALSLGGSQLEDAIADIVAKAGDHSKVTAAVRSKIVSDCCDAYLMSGWFRDIDLSNRAALTPMSELW